MDTTRKYLPVDTYGDKEVKLRFERLMKHSEYYKLYYSVDGGATWEVMMKYDHYNDVSENPDKTWSESMVDEDTIKDKIDKWRVNIKTYGDMYTEFLASSVKQYEKDMKRYEEFINRKTLPDIVEV